MFPFFTKKSTTLNNNASPEDEITKTIQENLDKTNKTAKHLKQQGDCFYGKKHFQSYLFSFKPDGKTLDFYLSAFTEQEMLDIIKVLPIKFPQITAFRTCSQIITPKVAEALKNLSQLEHLALVWTASINLSAKDAIDDSIAEIISQSSSLVTLDLSVNRIGDMGAEAIANSSTLKLKKLNLGSNEGITVEGAKHFVDKLNYTYLGFDMCAAAENRDLNIGISQTIAKNKKEKFEFSADIMSISSPSSHSAAEFKF